jgi:FAD/FMN-containing dehydrogenase
VLDLSGMKALDINVEHHTARAQTGLTAGESTTAAGAYGLATGFGDTGPVGLGGLTLASGVGSLFRTWSLTIADLLAAELVAADGRLLTTRRPASAEPGPARPAGPGARRRIARPTGSWTGTNHPPTGVHDPTGAADQRGRPQDAVGGGGVGGGW